ncbi:MAG: transcriptional regulator [Empedobacter falsenii]
MKKIYSFILLFLTLFLNAQSYDLKKIDELLELSLKEYADTRLIPSLISAEKAYSLSLKNNYDKGICKSSIDIAEVLLAVGMYKEALVYLERAELTSYYHLTPSIQTEIFRLRGRIYTYLKMYDLSLNEYRKQLNVSNLIKDEKLRNKSILFTHQNFVTTFNNMNLRDSSFTHILAQEKILKEHFNEDKDFYYFSTLYYQLGGYYTSQTKYDLAQKYLDKSLALLRKKKAPFLHTTLTAYAILEESRGNYTQAIKFYKEALHNADKIGAKTSKMLAYRNLADFYIENKLSQKEANIYLYNYQKLSDSLDVKNKELSQLVFAQIIDHKNLEHEKSSRLYIYIILFVFFILCIGALIWYFGNIKNKKNILKDKQELFKMSQNTVLLEKKIEENKFNDLLILAKRNDPEFLVLFEELYPHFIKRLKNNDPKIRSSELSFCAMSYLNFSAKDIATYTYVTVGAVEMRRNRLRKKYNVPSNIDFNSWMRKIK